MGVSVFDGYFWKGCALRRQSAHFFIFLRGADARNFLEQKTSPLFVVLGIAKREKMCYKEGYVWSYRNSG